MRVLPAAVLILASTLATQAFATPLDDSRALFSVLIQGSDGLSTALGATGRDEAIADKLEATVYAPVHAAREQWFAAGMALGSADDNPYNQFMVCHEAANELVYAAVEIVRFHRGMSGDLAKFEHTDPFIAKLRGCADLIAE